VFRDYGSVYLEIQVGSETLTPRLRVTAGAYALNASNLGGKAASEFLDTSAAPQSKASSLSLVSTDSNPGIYAQGVEAGGYFISSDYTGYAFAGLPNEGISAHGAAYGGRFYNTGANGTKVTLADSNIAVLASSAGNGYTALFQNLTTGGDVYLGNPFVAVLGISQSSQTGLEGRSVAGVGVLGESDTGVGVGGQSTTGIGGSFGVTSTSAYANVGYSTYKIQGSGAVSFVQNHPTEKNRVIVYSSPEGDEVGTYTRGTARLADGEARVRLGETFKWVTNPDIGLTAHLTPHGQAVPLAIVSLTPEELIVRGPDQGPKDLVFDYFVQGLRIGFEEVGVVQAKRQESFIPSMVDHRKSYEDHPELRAFNALERYKAAAESISGGHSVDLSRASALKNAIHEYDPRVDGPASGLLGYLQSPSRVGLPASSVDRSGGPSGLPAPAVTSPTTPAADAGSISEPARTRANAALAAGRPADSVRDTRPATAPDQAMSARHVEADWLPMAEGIELGDVLVAEPDGNRGAPLAKSSAVEDRAVVGIATGEPSDGLGPMAASGIVWCKVDATDAPIRAGDLLTTSRTPGRAMKSERAIPGTILGKALDALDQGTGLIRVVVALR
jgi:hypothetical protein